MGTKKSNRSALGYILIFLGCFFLLIKFGIISELAFLYFVGAGFLVTYFVLGGTQKYGNIGFLIPGVMILAISLFADLEALPVVTWIGGGLFFIFIAAAFMVVYLHTRCFLHQDWGQRNWPLFPAVGLACFAFFIFLAEHDVYIIGQIRLGTILIPALMIGLGVYLLSQGRNQEEMSDTKEDG